MFTLKRLMTHTRTLQTFLKVVFLSLFLYMLICLFCKHLGNVYVNLVPCSVLGLQQ